MSVSELKSEPEATRPAAPRAATSLRLSVKVSDSESVAEKVVVYVAEALPCPE